MSLNCNPVLNIKYVNEFDPNMLMNIYYIPNTIPIVKNLQSTYKPNTPLTLHHQSNCINTILPDPSIQSSKVLESETNKSGIQLKLKYKFIEKILENYLWKYPDTLTEFQAYIYSIIFNIDNSINNNSISDNSISDNSINNNFYTIIRKKFQEIRQKYNIHTKLGENTYGGVDRGSNRIKSIEKHILNKQSHKIIPSCYLDIGCYDGSITKSIADYFKLHKLQTHGVDVSNCHSDNNYTDITFTQYDGKILPFSDNSFDLITCLMVLHHIPIDNLYILMSEINRVMKPNGILILREHNVTNINDGHSLDIMHNFYDYVWNDIEIKTQWKTNYKSHTEWSDIFYLNGFVSYTSANIYNNNARNPFMTYMCSYIKLPKCNLIVNDMFRILDDNLPRVEYKRRGKEVKTVLHWGQRKLLLTEIEFFTMYFKTININEKKSIYAIYAGSAPGTHILYLSKLFPLIHFELYDPRDFCSNLLKNTKKIKTHIQYFTDETANNWKSEDHPDKIILFISDIRTGDTEHQSAEMVEERVVIDHEWQKNWYNIMKPEYSMFKFRLPWDDKKTEYLDGDIYFQPYPPITSTETRLIVSKNAKNKLYDNKKYEEQLFHFNNNVRPTQFNNILFNIDIIEKYGLQNNYDGASEVYILENYIRTIEKLEQPINENILKNKICNMIGAISNELSSTRTLFSQQPIKKNRYDILFKLQKSGYIPNNIKLNQNTFNIYVIPRYDFFKSKGLIP